MNNYHFAPWDSFPKFLTYRETINPISVIADFFSASSYKEHKRHLKEWRHFVLSEECYHDKKFGPGHLLFTYKLHVTLLEALYLIRLNYEAAYPKPAIPDELELLEETKNWIYYPKNLSEKELQNPYKVIAKVFKPVSLPEYREHLYQWLCEALTIKRMPERIDAADILLVYDSLLKLYSAAWIILQRSRQISMEIIQG